MHHPGQDRSLLVGEGVGGQMTMALAERMAVLHAGWRQTPPASAPQKCQNAQHQCWGGHEMPVPHAGTHTAVAGCTVAARWSPRTHLGWPPSLSARKRSMAVAAYECTTTLSLPSNAVQGCSRARSVWVGSWLRNTVTNLRASVGRATCARM